MLLWGRRELLWGIRQELIFGEGREDVPLGKKGAPPGKETRVDLWWREGGCFSGEEGSSSGE